MNYDHLKKIALLLSLGLISVNSNAMNSKDNRGYSSSEEEEGVSSEYAAFMDDITGVNAALNQNHSGDYDREYNESLREEAERGRRLGLFAVLDQSDVRQANRFYVQTNTEFAWKRAENEKLTVRLDRCIWNEDDIDTVKISVDGKPASGEQEKELRELFRDAWADLQPR